MQLNSWRHSKNLRSVLVVPGKAILILKQTSLEVFLVGEGIWHLFARSPVYSRSL